MPPRRALISAAVPGDAQATPKKRACNTSSPASAKKKLRDSQCLDVMSTAAAVLLDQQCAAQKQLVIQAMDKTPTLACFFLQLINTQERLSQARLIMDRNANRLQDTGDWFKRMLCNLVFFRKMSEGDTTSVFWQCKGSELNLILEYLMEIAT